MSTSRSPGRPEEARGQQEPDLHFCDGECLHPIVLRDALYGCDRCRSSEGPRPLEQLSNDSPIVSGETASRIRHDPGLCLREAVLCERHHLAVVPECPFCHRILNRYSRSTPISIVGGPSAGKTVFSAVAAWQLRSGQIGTTGIHPVFPGGVGGGFFSRVVDPLVFEGKLPQKTKVTEANTIACKLWGEWLKKPRSIKFTDLSGEFWQTADNPQYLSDAPEKGDTVVLLYSRETIFLLDPHASSEESKLAARKAPVTFEAVRQVLELLVQQGKIPTAIARLQQEAHALDQLLKREGFLGRPDNAAMLIAETYRAPELESEIRARLSTIAVNLRQRPPFENLAGQIIQKLVDNHHPRLPGGEDAKFAHRIAVVVSKADLLYGWDEKRIRALCDPPLPTKDAGRDKWREAVQRVSRESRRALVDLGEEEFVRRLESAFAEVGFFFITCLGRDAQLYVAETSSPGASSPVSRGLKTVGKGGSAGPVAISPASAPAWIIDERLAPSSRGRLAPEPMGVLLPFLWLVTLDG